MDGSCVHPPRQFCVRSHAKGVDCNRLVAVGFGETRLKITPETTPEDRLTNRRVDFIDAEINHEAIGGLPLDGGGRIAGNVCQ